MDDIFELVKEKNQIEDVIEEAGYPLRRSGSAYMKWTEHDSFVIDVRRQFFSRNGEQPVGLPDFGDVIDFVMWWKRTDAKGAVEYLARRAGLPEPTWGQPSEVRVATRRREDALTVAARVFVGWLRKDSEAMAYALGRGWTEETIAKAGLGFTGRGTPAEVEELRERMRAEGVELDSPAAVAVLGYVGNVEGWMRKHLEAWPTDWLSKQKLLGMPSGMLVYPHVYGGRVRYLSSRAIPEVAAEWVEKMKSYNLHSALVGSRQVFFNHVYGPRETRCVVVEGQADAITLGQWGIPAVAMAGTAADNDVLQVVRERHDHLYIAMDQDKAGDKAALPIGEALGPMSRMIRWPEQHKDLNDWLQYMVNELGLTDVGKQTELAQRTLDRARTYVEYVCGQVGNLQGSPKVDGMKEAATLINRMEAEDKSILLKDLAKHLGVTIRELNRLLSTNEKKNAQDERRKADNEKPEVEEITGGYIDGWLIEMTYDPEDMSTGFAYRDPDGNVGEAGYLDINKVRYVPMIPDSVIIKEAVVLPSGLGPKQTPSELVNEITAFIHKYYDIDSFFGRLAAFYIVFTWVYDSFRKLSYLRALGDWGSGKTEFIWRIGHLCYRMMKMTGAASTSAMFRLIDQYKGTLYMDEVDWKASEAEDDKIKILNTGNSKGNPVWRTIDIGDGKFKAEAYEVYGPKLLSMRKPFKDQATESRCITLNVRKRTTRELLAKGIPLEVGAAFFEEARELRNKLLTWRMHRWEPEIEVSNADIDVRIEPRLNQVTLPLKRLVDDPEMKEQIESFIRTYNDKLVQERSQTLEGKVLLAIYRIRNEPPEMIKGEPYWDITTMNIAKVLNKILDDENALDDPEKEEARKKRTYEITSRKVGSLLRNVGLETDRLTGGPNKGNYVLIWDELRIESLFESYGIEE